MGERRWVNRKVDWMLQEVVQAAVGPVVRSGTDAKEIWWRKGDKERK